MFNVCDPFSECAILRVQVGSLMDTQSHVLVRIILACVKAVSRCFDYPICQLKEIIRQSCLQSLPDFAY